MAKDKIAKTNAARLLDRDKVKYELVPYEVDENDLSCVHVAATLGENIEQVFKMLVLQGDKSGYFVCVIPGEHEIHSLRKPFLSRQTFQGLPTHHHHLIHGGLLKVL